MVKSAAPKKKELVTLVFPEGRLINSSLFEKDIYTDDKGVEGKPAYKCEVAFDPNDVVGDENRKVDAEEAIIDAIDAEWGEEGINEYFDGKVRVFIDGNKLAKDRESRGKAGDAYKGKLIIRANTMFNKDGQDGPGGASVYLPDTTPVDIGTRGEIYNGCMVKVAVAINPYLDARKDKCVSFYLTAVQKVGDGEKLVTAADHSKLFKPVGRTEGAPAGAGRRSRAG